jgi:hypothetical protein
VEDVESPNSLMAVEVGLDEIPSTLNSNSIVPHLLIVEVSPFHAIFNMNVVMIATHFNRGS